MFPESGYCRYLESINWVVDLPDRVRLQHVEALIGQSISPGPIFLIFGQGNWRLRINAGYGARSNTLVAP